MLTSPTNLLQIMRSSYIKIKKVCTMAKELLTWHTMKPSLKNFNSFESNVCKRDKYHLLYNLQIQRWKVKYTFSSASIGQETSAYEPTKIGCIPAAESKTTIESNRVNTSH